LGGLGLGDLVRKYPADAPPARVNFQHDARGILPILREKSFQYMNDEIHGRIVIVQ
jgi:hypothetical protein